MIRQQRFKKNIFKNWSRCTQKRENERERETERDRERQKERLEEDEPKRTERNRTTG